MDHLSGAAHSEHVIFIEGRGLGELADNISAKRVQSVHIHSEAEHGPAPAQVVTAVRFRGTIADAVD